MRKIITAEIRKIFSAKTLLVLLLALAVNWLLLSFGTSRTYPQYYPQPESYKAIYADLSGKTEQEKLDFLEKTFEKTSACLNLEMQVMAQQEGNETEFDPEASALMEKYRPDFENKSYLKYTDFPGAEYSLVFSLYNQAMKLNGYDEEIDNIIIQAQTKSSMPAFSKPGTFINKNLIKTADEYRTMYGIKTTLDVSDGVNTATQSVATDIIVVLFLLFVSGQLIIREKEKGILPVIKSTWKGRLPVISSKILVVFGISILCGLLFMGENLIYSELTFGLGDLSRSLQSVQGYMTSYLKLSVGEYLVSFILVKALAYFAAGMLSMLVCVVLFHPAPSYLCMTGIIGVSYLFYFIISPVSAWNLLKYINFANFLTVTPMFETYRNLNLFGQPALILPTVLTVMVLTLLVCIAVSAWLFCFGQTAERSLRLPRFLRLRKPLKLGKSVSLFYHESFKLLRENKAFLLLAVFILIQAFTQNSPVNYSMEDMVYKSYMIALSGEVNEKTAEYIENEENMFAEAEQAIYDISVKLANKEIDPQAADILMKKYQAILAPKPVFENKILPQYDYLLSQKEQGKKTSFVYDGGYRYLMCQPLGEYDTENENDIQNSAVLLLFMILCFGGLFSMEYQTGLDSIVSVYKNGRRKTALSKIAVSTILLAGLFVTAYLPDFLYAAKYYSLPEMNAALCSLPQFGEWSGGWKIWHYFALLYGMRFLTCVSVMLCIQVLSCKMRSYTGALCIGIGVILSPILLHLLGVRWLDWLSFLLPMSGNLLWIDYGASLWWLLYYGLALLLGGVAFAMLCRFPHIFREREHKTKKEKAETE